MDAELRATYQCRGNSRLAEVIETKEALIQSDGSVVEPVFSCFGAELVKGTLCALL
jgi:hypothetical protein